MQDLRISSMTITEFVHDCTHRWVLAQQRLRNGDDSVTDDEVQGLRISSMTITEFVHDCTHRWVLAQQ